MTKIIFKSEWKLCATAKHTVKHAKYLQFRWESLQYSSHHWEM